MEMFLNKSANESARSAMEESAGSYDSYDSHGSIESFDSADSYDGVITSSGSSSITDDGGVGGGMSNIFGDINTGVVIGVVAVALIITIVLFVTIVKRKKAPRGRFLKWLREFLNFRSILISGIIKFVYLFLATLLTIGSIVMMFQGKDDTVLQAIIIGLVILIAGNVLLRILMELTMAVIMLWENSSDIRAVLVKEEEKPDEPAEPKAPVKPEAPKEPETLQPTEEVVAEQPVAEQVAVEEVAVEQSVAPQPEAPQVEAQQPVAPQVEAPQAEAPQTESPQASAQ